MKYIRHNQHLTEEDKKYRYLYFCLLNTKLVYVGASHLLESRLRYLDIFYAVIEMIWLEYKKRSSS